MNKQLKKVLCRVALLFPILAAASAQAQTVRLPPGFEMIHITDDLPQFDGGWSNSLDINDCGEIVWGVRYGTDNTTSEIFHYDNGIVHQVTSNQIQDIFPEVNNRGTIVWIRRYADASTSIMTIEPGGSAQPFITNPAATAMTEVTINDVGHIAWVHRVGTICPGAISMGISLFDGATIQDVTPGLPPIADQIVRLNNQDSLSWSRYDFTTCDFNWSGDVMYRPLGGQELSISDLWTSRPNQSQSSHINDMGQAAFTYSTFSGFAQVLLWSERDNSFTEITDGTQGEDFIRGLNNRGDVAFLRWLHGANHWQAWLYRDGEYFPLTPATADGGTQGSSVNEYGEMAIDFGGYPNDDMWMLRRIRTGDSNFDGAIDARDAQLFSSCFTGPVLTPRLCDCRFLDIDYDGDVDCDDWKLFSGAWTGPGRLPAFGPCGPGADLNGDGFVNTLDLGVLLSSWTIPPSTGCAPPCPADLNHDGLVNTLDLGILLAAWTLT